MQTSMNICLSEPLKRWVEKQVAQRGFSNPSEFVRDVLRREQLQEMSGRVDEMLLAALNSGPASEVTADDWAQVRGRESNSSANPPA